MFSWGRVTEGVPQATFTKDGNLLPEEALVKASPPNTIAPGIKFQCMSFEVTSIQTITQCDLFIYLFNLEAGFHYRVQSGLELAV